MDAEFRQDLCKRTMVIKKESVKGNGFREKMVLKNNIKGTAKIALKYLNGEAYYSYDMLSCQTLKNVFEGNPMSDRELRSLFNGILRTAGELKKYLLDVKDLLMEPEHIFWDLDKEEPFFCYYPDNQEGEEGFLSLGQFLLDIVDKKNEEAAAAAYDYFDRLTEGLVLPRENFLNNGVCETGKSVGEKTVTVCQEAMNPVFEGDTDSLALSNLWNDDDNDNYYLDDAGTSEKEEKNSSKAFILLFFIPVILAAGAYAFIFTNPGLMEMLLINDTDYVRFGAGLTIFSGLLITLGVFIWNKRKKEEEARKRDMDSLSAAVEEEYRFDELEEMALEQAERKDEEDTDATVILSDLSGGRKGRQPELCGKVGGEDKIFKIEHTPFMIGKMKNKADAVISDAGVSRLHACIREEEGHYYLSDLNSTNGTSINERRLKASETSELFDGDSLRFADVSMTFRLA